jgi:hypothetical protein
MPPIYIEDGCLVLRVPFPRNTIGLPLGFRGISVAVAITCFALPISAADLPPDVEIEKLLVGRWSEREAEGDGSIVTTTTFARGGGWASEIVITKGERKATIKINGRWRVRDKAIVTTVETSTAPSIPAGTSSEDKLLEIDKKACRYRDEDGKEHSRMRVE